MRGSVTCCTQPFLLRVCMVRPAAMVCAALWFVRFRPEWTLEHAPHRAASPPLAGGTAYVSRPELGNSSRAAAPASCACHTLSATVQPACALPSSEAPGCTRAHQAIICGWHSAHAMWLCIEWRLSGEGGGGHMLGMQEQPSAGCNASMPDQLCDPANIAATLLD